jgi:hypothetical protein
MNYSSITQKQEYKPPIVPIQDPNNDEIIKEGNIEIE